MGSDTAREANALDIARLIDHTLLKPDATRDQIVQLCAEARAYHFASVCVNPGYVAVCAAELHDMPDIAICTGIGFPLGATLPSVKAFEAEAVIAVGATEVDMVQNIGALKSGDLDLLYRDMVAVVEVAHARGMLCKIILETALLSDVEKVTASEVAVRAGADFIKTSTGFVPGGATVADIALIRRTVGPAMGVKASGGVRSYAELLALIAAGATRIGASAAIKIVEEAAGQAAKPLRK